MFGMSVDGILKLGSLDRVSFF